MKLDIKSGLVDKAAYIQSPNYDDRPDGMVPEVIIVHSISLPPGEYENGFVEDFFCNRLNNSEHPYFEEIGHLTVSSHFFIQRNGALIQFVPTDKRAWHAGESTCLGKPAVNNFSIGIELEGWDEADDGYTDQQYLVLQELVDCLKRGYPKITNSNLFAHSDIAPDRKTDPGPFFQWQRIV